MIVYRCFPPRRSVGEHREGNALWFPRAYQGRGRHDNPDLYGCLYVGEDEIAPVAEQLQAFRGGRRLATWMLEREGVPLALAAIDLPDDAVILDLDDPAVLVGEELRPSQVATHDRARTQADARTLFERHTEAAALRWWSSLEASWLNLTIFERAAPALHVARQRELSVFDPAVREAAEFLGLG